LVIVACEGVHPVGEIRAYVACVRVV